MGCQTRNEAALECWRQFRKSNLTSLLRQVYETYKSWPGYEERLDWKEGETEIVIRVGTGGDVPFYQWNELSLEGTELGVVLSCQKKLSNKLNSRMKDWAFESWTARARVFGFRTLIDIRDASEDDLLECFEYIRGGNKPKLAEE
jgi:hypothetical protein